MTLDANLALFTPASSGRPKRAAVFLAVFGPAVAAAVTWRIEPLRASPFPLFAAAVALTARLGGARAAVFSLTLSWAGLLVILRQTPEWETAAGALGVQAAGFTAVMGMVIAVTASRLRAISRLRGLNDDLERRVQEREVVTRRLALIAERTDNAVILTDAAGRIEWVNEGFTRITEYTAAEVLGQKPGTLLRGPGTDPRTVAFMRERLRAGPGFQADVLNYAKSGRPYWLAIEVQPIRDAAGRVAQFMAIERDITEAKWAEAALRESQERLRQANGALETRVRERTAELQAATAEAERANLAKSDFLSRLSHELRTPLNAVLGFAQVLRMGALTPRQARHVEQIDKGGRHLLGLINEVLDFARIEAGWLDLTPEAVPLARALDDVMDLIRPLADERGIAVVGADAGGRLVRADGQRLRQVFLNLLSNAVKYNTAGGRVTLTVADDPDGRVRVSVADTGRGLTADQRAKLFRPFERLGAEAAGTEGTGLGLVLSKRLVDAMAGELGVADHAGPGSTFYVCLPRADAGERATPVPDSAFGAAEPEAPDFTLLYVEDNPDNLALIEDVMAERPRVRLLAAARGGLGLELAERRQPTAILLDVHLPDMTGDVFLRRLRADPRTWDIPVVALSADASPAQVARLRAAGAADYLTKPVNVSKLLAVLDSLTTVGTDL